MGILVRCIGGRAAAQRQHQTVYVKIHLLQMPFRFVIVCLDFKWISSSVLNQKWNVFTRKPISILLAFVTVEKFLFASLSEMNDLHTFQLYHKNTYRICVCVSLCAGRFNRDQPLSVRCATRVVIERHAKYVNEVKCIHYMRGTRHVQAHCAQMLIQSSLIVNETIIINRHRFNLMNYEVNFSLATC